MENEEQAKLRKELDKVIKMIDESQKALKKLPRGTIYINEVNGRKYVYRKRKENGKVVSKYLGIKDTSKIDKELEKYEEYKNIKHDLADNRKQYKYLIKMINEYSRYQKKRERIKNKEDITQFAINVNSVDGEKPSNKAVMLMKLLELKIIDIETYDFAIKRLYAHE